LTEVNQQFFEKDMYKKMFTKNGQKVIIRIVYHLGNMALFVLLLNFLNLIQILR